jgi:hypothetical protein
MAHKNNRINPNIKLLAGFEVYTAALINVQFLSDMNPSLLTNSYRRFGGA